MKNKYSLPIIKVVEIQKKKDCIVTTIEIVEKKNYFHEPIAPAWLGGDKFSFDLHKLLSYNGNELIFETYTVDSALPIQGKKYTFCSTFMSSQLELIKDTSKKWVKKKFDKDLCNCDLALWGNITEEGPYGYTDGTHWITIEDYEKYIKDDILRVRQSYTKHS